MPGPPFWGKYIVLYLITTFHQSATIESPDRGTRVPWYLRYPGMLWMSQWPHRRSSEFCSLQAGFDEPIRLYPKNTKSSLTDTEQLVRVLGPSR